MAESTQPTETTWSTARTEAFSDGVFAIAITLLVLELAVPEEDFADLWSGIAGQWTSFLGYVTSFLTIGGIWLSHHALFGRLRSVNRRIMQLNLLLLMTVSFLPFPTRLVAEALADADAERVAVIFYGATLLVISTLLYALWQTAAASPHLLAAGVEPGTVARMANARAPSFAFYAAATAIALIGPRIAAFGYLVIAAVAVLTASGDEPGPSTAD